MSQEEFKAYPNPSKTKTFAESIAETPQYNNRAEDLNWWKKVEGETKSKSFPKFKQTNNK